LTQNPGIVSPQRSMLIVMDGRRTFPQDPKSGTILTRFFPAVARKDISPGPIPGWSGI